MTVDELLQHSAAIVRRRRRTYGEPAVLFERAAVRWSQVLGTKITPAQVVLCLIELKLARLAHDPRHSDTLLDVIGYAACLWEVTRDA